MVAVNTATIVQFRALFEQPSTPGILQLTPASAEKFIQYVFESAGFSVSNVATKYFPEGPGVDLTISNPLETNTLLHFVEVKRWSTPVPPEPVQAFGWKLQQHGVTGYFVAMSGFTPAAQAVAALDHNIILIDGAHLIRYISYLGRSRVDKAYTGIQLPLALPAGPEWTLRADEITKATPASPARARVLAVANNKGGVGKSTTARCLALGLASKEMRVLLIDMDAQANLTEFLLSDISLDEVSPNLAGYFAGNYPLSSAIHSVPKQKLLHLIPGHLDLGMLDTGGSGHPDVELRFVEDLYRLATDRGPESVDGFAWVILDTPPAVSLFTRAALATADIVIAPARARGSSARGTHSALRARHAMNGLMGRGEAAFSCVMTHWQNDQRSRDGRARVQVQVTGLGGHMLTAAIPLSTAVESPQPPKAIRQAYDAILTEVLNDVNSR